MPTPAISPPQSPPSKKSSARVRVSATAPSPILIFFLALLSSSSSAAAAAEISYAAHCSATVPESAPTGESITSSVFQLVNGHFAGGEPLVSRDANPSPLLPSSFFFHPKSLHRTVSSDIFQLSGTLTFRGGSRSAPRNATVAVADRRPRRLRYRPHLPRFGRRKKLTFDLTGFWSASTGTLCMVGRGNARSAEGIPVQPSSIVKLNYPNSSNISSSLVGGVVESLDPIGSSNHFTSISVITYAQREYKYSAISDAESSCSKLNVGDELLGLGNSSCFYMKSFLGGQFKMDYRRDCSDRNCGPFERSTGFLPLFVSLNQVECSDDGKVHMYIGFSNVSVFISGSLFVPERALVAEGIWDPNRHRVCLVACRVQNDSGALLPASVGDCSIRITLWFPAVQTIVSRSSVVGRIWSSRNEDEPGYFDMVSFRSNKAYMNILNGVRYEYTKVDVARKSCVPDSDRSRGKKRYPDGKSFKDLRFDMSVKNAERKTTWGHATPDSIGETFYDSSYMVASPFKDSQSALLGMDHSSWNVSYKIVYTFPNASLLINEPTVIFAEGIYNTRTGMICMVGCQYRNFPNDTKHTTYGNNMDCGILINIQLPPLNPEADEHLTGTIKSTREKKDPLFFAPLQISYYEMYTKQAAESIWRMDIEISMVLISLTGFCIFIGLQLFHIKKHPEVLPFISITMLVVLTLGHMIPLVLNFEALFLMSRNRKNVLLWSGGWLEVNEVVVRVIMMVAFLLLCRLLQVVWFSRSEDKGKEGGFWVAERRTFLSCLPLYFAGALIAWFVHLRSHDTQLQRPSFISADRHSLWEDMISYAGLILDGFLLPQIIFNAFINSKDRPLVPSFYIGTTVVRALPHLYDGYRARHYVPHFNQSYIYANPDGDFYSFAWDIIIPCGGILFAALTYVQQQFGGFFYLRKKEQSGGYEMVPVVSH